MGDIEKSSNIRFNGYTAVLGLPQLFGKDSFWSEFERNAQTCDESFQFLPVPFTMKHYATIVLIPSLLNTLIRRGIFVKDILYRNRLDVSETLKYRGAWALYYLVGYVADLISIPPDELFVPDTYIRQQETVFDVAGIDAKLYERAVEHAESRCIKINNYAAFGQYASKHLRDGLRTRGIKERKQYRYSTLPDGTKLTEHIDKDKAIQRLLTIDDEVHALSPEEFIVAKQLRASVREALFTVIQDLPDTLLDTGSDGAVERAFLLEILLILCDVREKQGQAFFALPKTNERAMLGREIKKFALTVLEIERSVEFDKIFTFTFALALNLLNDDLFKERMRVELDDNQLGPNAA